MAQTGLSATIRQRLYTFARGLASPFTDSRRRRLVQDMVAGLVVAGDVHLSKIARAACPGQDIHAAEKRLSLHLGSEHGDASPLAVTELATQLAPPRWPRRWPRGGLSVSCPVRLPEVADEEFLGE